MPLAAHGVSHKGRRKTNEDSMVVDPARGLFVVADGMGGHNAGEVASALAVQTLQEALDGEPPTESALSEALSLANDRVLAAAASDPTYQGMGTTVVAACVTDGRLIFGNVGDSRIYHLRARRLEQLTRDDSWVSRVLPAEALSSEELLRHPMRHVLTKVVGLRDDMEPTVESIDLSSGDVLLLCSDGLHGSVGDDAIAKQLGRGDPVETIAQELVDQALAAGASDNITVVVVSYA